MRRRSKGRDEGRAVGRSKAVSRRRWDEEQTLGSFVQIFGYGTKWLAFESELSDGHVPMLSFRDFENTFESTEVWGTLSTRPHV